MRTLFAGNWKMFGLRAALAEIRALSRAFAQAPPPGEIIVCPPATLIAEAAQAMAGTRIGVGGQDCHAEPMGAFTGDISAEMLYDAGARFVIVGHSERRHYHGETDAMVAAKVRAARRAGLTPILCVGESEAIRDAGEAEQMVAAQLAASLPEEAGAEGLVVAYEPVWAIGTGRTPSSAQIEDMHGALRRAVCHRFGPEGNETRILYGGSVKPANAVEILKVEGVNGALVGGASLKSADFIAIIRAAPSPS